jgi:hypothetical protein
MFMMNNNASNKENSLSYSIAHGTMGLAVSLYNMTDLHEEGLNESSCNTGALFASVIFFTLAGSRPFQQQPIFKDQRSMSRNMFYSANDILQIKLFLASLNRFIFIIIIIYLLTPMCGIEIKRNYSYTTHSQLKTMS